MIVYRIEHPDSKSGPYEHSKSPIKNCSAEGPNGEPRPGPYSMSGYKNADWKDEDHPSYVPRDDRRYAYIKLSALFTWWSPKEMSDLVKAGFNLATYEATPLCSSDVQCVFDFRHAKRLDVTPLPLHPQYARRKKTVVTV